MVVRTFTRYGRKWPIDASEIDIELWCFKYAWPVEKGGLGRYGHAVNCINLLWNYKGSPTPVVWTPWVEYGLKHACENNVCIMGGGSSCGKSMMMAIMALLFYLSDPKHTMCLITSTTIEGAKKRIFKDVKRFWRSYFPGKLVDGQGKIKGINEEEEIDDSQGIVIIPCANIGDPTSRFIGIKSPNMHVFYDELSELPIELVDVWRTNLNTNAIDTPPTLMAASNPKSRTDAFGIMAMPKGGWNSVDIFTEETWETSEGIYVRFDNTKNPRIACNREDWAFYVSRPTIEAAVRQYGADSAFIQRFHKATFSDDIEEGALLSEAEIYSAGADGMPVFGPKPILKIASLDPAYTNGGDQSVVRVAKVGYDLNDNLCVFVCARYALKSTKRKEDLKARNFDIAKQCLDILEKEEVSPENFVVDITGGAAFADILASYIGPKFVSVSFAGKASNTPISASMPGLACDQYANKVSELWGVMKLAIASQQLYGLDSKDILEMKSRLYTSENGKIKVEPKKNMKKRIRHSPDDADAIALLVHLVRMKFGLAFAKMPDNAPTTQSRPRYKFELDSKGNPILRSSEISQYLHDPDQAAKQPAPMIRSLQNQVQQLGALLWS